MSKLLDGKVVVVTGAGGGIDDDFSIQQLAHAVLSVLV